MFLIISFQSRVVAMVPRRKRSFFLFATTKDCHRLRAQCKIHHTQFTGSQVMVQHLVQALTSRLPIMLTVTWSQEQTLAMATQFQAK